MKEIYSYPYPAQSIKILLVQETVKKQKDKPDITGFEVIFSHGKIVQSCFMEKAPKEGPATADLEIKPNFGKGLRVVILSLKQ